jgi:hypothetical protein
MNRILLLSIVLLGLGYFLTRCAQNKDELTTQSVGLLMDWSSFDGCGWVIELKNSDHTILEPNNLLQFNITLTDSMLVKFVYEVDADQSSSCMAGTVVHLLEISPN